MFAGNKQAGQLPSVQLGGNLRVNGEDLEGYIHNHRCHLQHGEWQFLKLAKIVNMDHAWRTRYPYNSGCLGVHTGLGVVSLPDGVGFFSLENVKKGKVPHSTGYRRFALLPKVSP